MTGACCSGFISAGVGTAELVTSSLAVINLIQNMKAPAHFERASGKQIFATHHKR
jgi:hypothetical protein